MRDYINNLNLKKLSEIRLENLNNLQALYISSIIEAAVLHSIALLPTIFLNEPILYPFITTAYTISNTYKLSKNWKYFRAVLSKDILKLSIIPEFYGNYWHIKEIIYNKDEYVKNCYTLQLMTSFSMIAGHFLVLHNRIHSGLELATKCLDEVDLLHNNSNHICSEPLLLALYHSEVSDDFS